MTALLLAWPFAQTPFDDDWTWALTVKQLQATGHLIYNGWSSPAVIAQAYWGLLWTRLLGFSFNVLKISTLPMCAGSVSVAYLLGRHCGLAAGLAAFVALMLGLSPLFMPMESSFMSDLPGLFFMLFSMYALVRGYEQNSAGWILAGTALALIGGSSRQVVWIVPLVVLPYFAWLRRDNTRFVVGAIAGWILVVIGAVGMQQWFARQPYALPDPPLSAFVREALRHPTKQVISMLWVLLSMMLFALPAAVGAWRRLPLAKVLLATVIFILLFRVTHHYDRVLMPWMKNIITVTGVPSCSDLSGEPPIALTPRIRYGISMVVFASISLLIASAIIWCRRPAAAMKNTIAFFFRPAGENAAVAAVFLTSGAYLALELTRCIFGVAYDRHLLPLIPFAGILILAALQHGGIKHVPILCWTVLVIFAAYGIASTQELNSLQRARVIAIQRLKDAGVTDPQIEAGFEHDYWTEAELFGHINDARLRNPPGAYDPTQGPIPHMKFVYCLERRPTALTAAASFGQVDYFSLLPPFHRAICIDQYTAPPPPAKSYLPEILLEQYRAK